MKKQFLGSIIAVFTVYGCANKQFGTDLMETGNLFMEMSQLKQVFGVQQASQASMEAASKMYNLGYAAERVGKHVLQNAEREEHKENVSDEKIFSEQPNSAYTSNDSSDVSSYDDKHGLTKKDLFKEKIGSSKGCQKNLGYLASQLRDYKDPMLSQVRTEIINTDIIDAIRKAKELGYNRSQAMQDVLKDAKNLENAAITSINAAEQTASHSSIVYQAADNTLDKNHKCTPGINASMICSFIGHAWGAVSMRAVATHMACNWN